MRDGADTEQARGMGGYRSLQPHNTPACEWFHEICDFLREASAGGADHAPGGK